MKALVLLEAMVRPPPSAFCHRSQAPPVLNVITMHHVAAATTQDGDRNAVRLQDVPMPHLPEPDWALVRVAAAALNHRDEWMRMVRYLPRPAFHETTHI